MSKYRADLIVCTLLAFLMILLHHAALGNYWLFDDLQILKQANQYHPWEYFFVPHVWHEVSVSNFTPWVTLSFDMDLNLFGFRPEFFYIHQLFAVWLSAVLLYMVLRLWVPRRYAFCGSLLFSVSAPVMFSAEFLCLRHYVEGSVFVLTSLILFVSALRRNDFRLAFLSAAAYFLAMLAKEVYIPFLLVLPFLPEDKWLSRLKFALPHIIALFSYLLWRSLMLGRTVGGYESSLFQGGVLSEVRQVVLVKVPESLKMLTGVSEVSEPLHIVVLALTALLVTAALVIGLRRRKFLGIASLAILAACLYAPIALHFTPFSVAAFETYRLLFHFSLGYAVIVVLLTHELSAGGRSATDSGSRRESLMLVLLAAVTSLILFSSYGWFVKQRKDIVAPLNAEGRFLMASGEEDIMVKSNILPNDAYYEMMDYFRRIYKKQRIPDVVYDVFFGVGDDSLSDLHERRVFKYSKAEKRMTDITPEFVAGRAAYFSHIRKLPLQVKLDMKGGAVNYSVGPSSRGLYFLLVGYRRGVYNTVMGPLSPSSTGRVFPGVIKWYIRFGWRSPDGWVTLSPEWLLDSSRDTEIAWRRQ